MRIQPKDTAKTALPTREELIAQLAYLRAEKRGFVPGGELQDWLEAEAEVDRATRVEG